MAPAAHFPHVPASLPAPGSVIVHVVDPSRVAGNHLSAAENEQAARFRFEKDARHWRACRSALRAILGGALGIAPESVPLGFAEFGKPLLQAPFDFLHFNLSHCHDLALVALCVDGPLGIDLEPADRGKSLLGCEHAFCHPDEIAGLPETEDKRADVLLDIWTSKEALLKALGTGMSLAPETVPLRPPGERGAGPHPRLQPFRLQRVEHVSLQKHYARLAMPSVTRDILIFI